MNAPIERVDSLDGAQPGEIIKPVDRSGKEKDDRGFAKALKDKMREELEEERKKKHQDRLELTGGADSDGDEKNPAKSGPNDKQSPRNDENEDDPPEAEHIDIKA